MYRDKKMSAGALRLVLLKDIGCAVLERDDGVTLAATLERYLAA